MSLDQDVAAARRAVEELEKACTMVTRHFAETVDARRLRVDVARLRDDLTLLCGAAHADTSSADRSSATVYWDDGIDMGAAESDRTRR